jgi:hypothetical protein
MTGLQKYLATRFADTVVLTFAQIEDLLGSPLPDEARRNESWWTAPPPAIAGPNYSDSWTLAGRGAVPNLSARIVVFDRVT